MHTKGTFKPQDTGPASKDPTLPGGGNKPGDTGPILRGPKRVKPGL